MLRLALATVFFLAGPALSEPAADLLKEVKAKVAPDERVTYFQVETARAGDKTVLKGRVLTPEQKQAVEAAFGAQGPIDSHIQVFPFAEPSHAVVMASVLNVRGEPRHGAELVTQGLMGAPVRILEERNDWVRIQMLDDQYIGWAERASLVLGSRETVQAWNEKPKVLVNVPLAQITDQFGGKPIARAYLSTRLSLLKTYPKAFQVRLPDGRKGFIKKEEGKLPKGPEAACERPLIEQGKTLLGVPYLWGGTSAAMLDCSGFTQTLYRMYGHQLPRDADQQMDSTKRIDRHQLKPGDLIFFSEHKKWPTHVGIYMGDGRFIHSAASRGGVSINSLTPGAPEYVKWYDDNYMGAGRVL